MQGIKWSFIMIWWSLKIDFDHCCTWNEYEHHAVLVKSDVGVTYHQ